MELRDNKIIIDKKTLKRLKSLNQQKKVKEELKKKKLQELLIIIPFLIMSKKEDVKSKPQEKRVHIKKEDVDKLKKEKEKKKKQEEKKIFIEKKDIDKIKKVQIQKEKQELKPKESKQELKEQPGIVPRVLVTTPILISKVLSDKKPIKKETKPKTKKDTTSKIKEKEEKKQTQEEIESDNLEKYQSYKIVEQYSNHLKDIRYELRKIDYKYQLIQDSYENTYKEKEIEIILDNLNELIKKIDELKDKLEIPNKYDDKYIYDLVQEYIKEFNNNNIVKNIESSPLFIEISSKIKELTTTKDKLKDDVEKRQEDIKKSNEKLDETKTKFDKFRKESADIDKFSKTAANELRNLTRLVNSAVSIREIVQVRVRNANRFSRMILAAIATDLAINTRQSARSVAIKVAIGTMVLRHMMNNRYRTREEIHYQIKDHTDKIKDEIKNIKDVDRSLSKTSYEIKDIIKNFKSEYKDYIDNDTEFSSLLANLEEIDSNIDEKRYMINNIMDKEETLLRDHSNKILTINNSN